MALLLRALMLRRVHAAGVPISLPRLLSELDAIREVVNIYRTKRRGRSPPTHAVLTKTSELQHELLSILHLERSDTELG